MSSKRKSSKPIRVSEHEGTHNSIECLSQPAQNITTGFSNGISSAGSVGTTFQPLISNQSMNGFYVEPEQIGSFTPRRFSNPVGDDSSFNQVGMATQNTYSMDSQWLENNKQLQKAHHSAVPSPHLYDGKQHSPRVGNSGTQPTARKSSKTKYKFQRNSNIDVKYKCDVCLYCTNRSDHYKRHLITHSEEKPLKCSRCGYGTGRSDHFRRHLARHGFSPQEILQHCEMNGLKSAPHQGKHFLKATSTNGSVVGGSQNDQPRTYIVGDIRNAESSVVADKKFQCELCGYSTDRSSHYNRHVKTHTDKKPFHCTACGKTFKLDTYLKKHRCTVEVETMPLALSPTNDECVTAQLTFSAPSTFSGVGNEDFTAACAACGVWFHNQNDLSSHICPHMRTYLL
ncbi:uncharacterized protein LOC143465647 [Clavelina lepadiformis]|uniref:uncharacterized protein LOC143465647 n=1 Tax=Clavelina lepadiformis TaxID=159417 RepID=UPI004041AFA1